MNTNEPVYSVVGQVSLGLLPHVPQWDVPLVDYGYICTIDAKSANV